MTNRCLCPHEKKSAYEMKSKGVIVTSWWERAYTVPACPRHGESVREYLEGREDA